MLDNINRYFTKAVTVFLSQDGYTKAGEKVLYAFVNRQEMARLHRLINQVDDDAFDATHDIKSAFGGGFK